jgi:GNAT superfamily N-acetyltransferase
MKAARWHKGDRPVNGVCPGEFCAAVMGQRSSERKEGVVEAVSVRSAELRDREALCRLYYEFHEYHVRGVPDRLRGLGEPPDTYAGSELYQALTRILQDDDAAIFLAQVARRTVGLVEAYLRQDEPNPLRVSRRYGYLQSLMVDEAFRRRGIGTQLMDAAQRWAQDKGAAEMRLEIWEFEAGPLRFYEGRGYRTLRRTLVCEL